MEAGWSTDATRALIAIWGEQNIQQNLDGVTRNKTIFEKNVAAMKEKGYDLLQAVPHESKESQGQVQQSK